MIGRIGKIGLFHRPDNKDFEIAEQMMELTRIGHLRNRPVGQISGGESQKVNLARALTQEPEILLLDEPFANLDPQAVRELSRLVLEAYERFKLTIVMVTHQLEHLPEICNRVVMMKDTRIVFNGARNEALTPQRIKRLFDNV